MKKFHRFVTLLAGIMLLLVVVVTVASIGGFRQIRNSAEERKQAFLLLGKTNDLQAQLINAQNSQRGYLITNDESFYESYMAAHDSIYTQLALLEQLAKTDSGHVHLNALVPMITVKMAYLANSIQLYRTNKMDSVLIAMYGRNGMRLTDSILGTIQTLVQIEQGALASHDSTFRTSLRFLFVVVVVACMGMLVFALMFAYMIHREAQRRLKNYEFIESQRLLAVQEKANVQLQLANNALTISEERFSVTLGSIGDGVIATDAQGCITFLNPVAEHLCGWSLAESVGHQVDDIFTIVHEETRAPALIPINNALIHGTVQMLANHTVLISRTGSECSIADSCAPIRNHDGGVVGAVLVFRDVSKESSIQKGLAATRKELEINKHLADEAAEFSESLINTVREPLLSLDQDLRVVSVSRSFYEFFKVNPAETVGQLIYDLGNKQWDIPKLRELLETILPQKSNFENYEVVHNFDTIGKRTMLLNARQIQRVYGKERIILLAIEDITERKKIEDDLKNVRRDLESRLSRGEHLRLLGQLTSGVAHEVRNPLNGIMAIMGALSLELNDDQRFNPHMVHMRNQVSRLTSLMENLLDLGKPIHQETMLVVPMVELVEHAITTWLQTMQTPKPAVHLVKPVSTVECTIRADVALITQVVINLLQNAHDHCAKGTDIDCSIEVRMGNVIAFSVKDAGTGILPENLQRIFDPFFTTRKEGTGLGLSIVRTIVENHGGSISAWNNVPVPGATFEVVLPLGSVTEYVD